MQYFLTIIEILFYIVSFFIGLYLSMILHELGHLVCGLLTGYKFNSFVLFKWQWFKNKKGKIRVKKTATIEGILGQCLMEPIDFKNFRYLLYNLGGGLVNLLTGIIFWLIYFFLATGNLSILCFGIAFAATFLAFTNLFPLRKIATPNDGANIREANKSEVAKYGFYIQLKVNAEQAKGKKLTEYDKNTFLVDKKADLTNYLIAYTVVLNATYLEEKGKYKESYKELLRIDPEELPGFYRCYVLLCLIFQELVYFDDYKTAKKRLKDNENHKFFQTLLKMKHPAFMQINAAKKAFIDHDIKAANKLIKETKKAIPSLNNSGSEHSIKVSISSLEEKIKVIDV